MKQLLTLLSEGHVVRSTGGKFSIDTLNHIGLQAVIKSAGADHDDGPTQEGMFERYESTEATFSQILNEALGLARKSDNLFFTKAQILSIERDSLELFFKDKQREHLFFYKNKKGNYFVFLIYFAHGEWYKEFGSIDADISHCKENRTLFLPQQ